MKTVLSRPQRQRGQTLSPPLLFALALLLFSAGLGLGWTGGAAHEEAIPGAAAACSVPAATLPPVQTPAPPSDEPVPAQPAGENWALRLVNADHPLPDGFAVPELTQLRSGQAVDSRAYPDLQRMMDDARAVGLQPVICSSCRSWEEQEQLFEQEVQNWINRGYIREEAEGKAATWVARPGASEHQTGLALDIVDLSYQTLDEGQEDTPVQRWLMEHCADYGFILRYPTGKSALTGVSYEPWHYRYVGVEVAQAIMEQGLCLEEYLA